MMMNVFKNKKFVAVIIAVMICVAVVLCAVFWGGRDKAPVITDPTPTEVVEATEAVVETEPEETGDAPGEIVNTPNSQPDDTPDSQPDGTLDSQTAPMTEQNSDSSADDSSFSATPIIIAAVAAVAVIGVVVVLAIKKKK